MKDVGKKCYVISKNSIYFGEWGIIKAFDGIYHVAILNDKNLMVVFNRSEIYIPRKEICKNVKVTQIEAE